MKHECKSCLIALGDETRVTIYYYLLGKTMCVSDLTSLLKLSQSTVSYHLGVLLKRGLITKQEKGRNTYYSIKKECTFYTSKCVLTNISK